MTVAGIAPDARLPGRLGVNKTRPSATADDIQKRCTGRGVAEGQAAGIAGILVENVTGAGVVPGNLRTCCSSWSSTG
jgi:hypothetical protein